MEKYNALSELDALADELLVKSEKPEKMEKEPEPEDNTPKPEDIADGAQSSENDDSDNQKEEPENDDEGDDDAEDTPNKEDMEKSMQSEFENVEPIKKGIEASEFLNSIVGILSKSLSDFEYQMGNNLVQQEEVNGILAKSLKATLKANNKLVQENQQLKERLDNLEKSMSENFEEIKSMLETTQSQPGIRKSLKSLNIQDRNFSASLNGNVKPKEFESLTKSQILTALEGELTRGNSLVTPNDIISYESGAPLREELKQMVISKFK